MKTILFLVSLVCFFSLSSQNLSLDDNETYAVVVGISDYQDEGIPDLRFADKDALAFAGFLQSTMGGSLDEDHLRVMINEQATGAQFAKALDWLWEVTGENDRVIIYFSGHGDVERKSITQPGYLLGWDAPSRVYMAGGAMNVRDLNDVVSTLSIQNKAKVILITDACRAGKLSGSSIGGAQATAANLAKQFDNEIKILSCQPDEYSIEGEQWGGGRGAFSYHLLDGLMGMADRNTDQAVNLMEIRSYLEENVSAEVAPHSQLPMVVGNVREKITDVFPEILDQLKEGRKGQLQLFTPTESRGMEDDVLAAADTNVVEMYFAFQKALLNKEFLTPKDACADVYYEQLIKEPSLSKLHSSMRRNYAAALQDDAQQEMNTMLKTGLTDQILKNASASDLYKHYPAYLTRAAELLGESHYMYKTLLARKYFFEGKMQKKRKKRRPFYKKALSLQPDMSHAYSELIDASGNDQLDSALYYFKKATELVPSWVEPYIEMSYFYQYATKQLDKAEEMLQLAGEIDSTSILVWYYKATFYKRRTVRKYDESEKWYLKVIESSGKDICFPCVYNDLGNLYLNTRRYAEAEKYLKKGIQLDSINSSKYKSFCVPCGYMNLGNVYLDTRRYNEAENVFKKVLQHDSTFLGAYVNLGNVYTDTRRFNEAEESFKKAIQLDSTFFQAYVTLGGVYTDLHRYVEAEEVYKKAIKINPNFSTSYQNLGFLYQQIQRNDEVEKLLKKAIELDSFNIGAYNSLGVFYQNAGRLEDAEAIFFKVLQLDSIHAPAWVNLGVVYTSLNSPKKAEQAFNNALALDFPFAHPFAYNGLGQLYMKQNNFSEAEKYFEKAIESNPYFKPAYLQKANLCLKTAQFEAAKASIDKLLELNPDNEIAAVLLAQWSVKTNQLENAWRYLNDGLEKGYNDLENLKSESDFNEMRKNPKWEALMKQYFPEQYKK